MLALPLGFLYALLTGCAGEEPHYLSPLDLSTATDGGQSELPCAVVKLLTTRCTGCHGQPPAGAPIALVTYADLTAKSSLDPAFTIAERALARMQDNSAPMPPGPAATVPQSELTPLQMWVTAGTPKTTCAVK